MVVISIFTFVVLTLYGIIYTGDVNWQLTQNLMQLQQQARLGMDYMSREMRLGKASTINIGAGGNSISYILKDDTNPVTYSKNGTRLERSRLLITKCLANNVSGLSFCCWHSTSCDSNCSTTNVIKISLETSKTVKGKNLSVPVQTLVNLRND